VRQKQQMTTPRRRRHPVTKTSPEFDCNMTPLPLSYLAVRSYGPEATPEKKEAYHHVPRIKARVRDNSWIRCFLVHLQRRVDCADRDWAAAIGDLCTLEERGSSLVGIGK
jgi:hypothetical protein